MRLGIHLSVAGGLGKAAKEARKLGLGCLQIFATSPRVWKQREIPQEEAAEFSRAMRELDLGPVAVHAPYLLNLAALDEGLWQKSLEALTDQLERARALVASGVVLHPGSRGGMPLEWGMDRVARGVALALDRAGAGPGGPGVWLENTAGGGGNLGGTLAQMGLLLDRLEGLPVGVCLDTAHAWAAGYHLDGEAGVSAFLAKVEALVGMKRVKMWHFNDIATARGSKRDIHTHLGKGLLGKEGLGALVGHPAMAGAALVMETPKDSRWADRRNLAFLKKLVRDRASSGNS